jgi:hypothetical protein
MTPLELDGRDLPETGVTPGWVVPAFDELEHGLAIDSPCF